MWTLKRRLTGVAFVLTCWTSAFIAAQSPGPFFEVSTVRPSPRDAEGKFGGMRGTQFYATNFTVVDVLSFAYDVHPAQILRGPDWITSERFDIVAKANSVDAPSTDRLKVMVQRFLADRFALATRREQKELDVYAITIASGRGERVRLKPTAASPETLPIIQSNYGSIRATNATMADLAATLQRSVANRPVLDRTGLTGRFDFELMWAPDEFQYPGRATPTGNPGGPSIFTAFQEQLGLQLRSVKARAEVLIIERIQRPTEN